MPSAAIPFFRSERTRVGAIVALAVIPVLFILTRAVLVSRNVAYWDELDTALGLLLRLHQSPTWSEVLASLFALGNEHRTFTSRLLFATSYWTTGTINFSVIGAIGNLFICALCGLLIYTAGTTVRRVLMGVLLALLIFQLEHYENFQWSGSSIDHFQVVLLAGASVIGLSRGTRAGFLAGMLFALLATLTLAHGMVAWVVGAVMLGVDRRWRGLAIWLVSGAIAAAIFLLGFDFNPGHNIGVLSGRSLISIGRYWLSLLGAPLALGQAAIQPFLGVAFLLLFGRVLVRGALARERIAAPLALWAVGAMALIAIGRADLTQGVIYSRYYILGSLAWALVLFLLFTEQPDAARPYRLLLRFLPVLVGFNLAANFLFLHDARSWVICRNNAADHYHEFGRDGVGRFTLYPHPAVATALLRKVETAGVYQMPLTCEKRSFPQAKVATDLLYFLDRILVNDYTITAEGWVARPGRKAAADEIHLILQSKQSRHIFSTIPIERPDVAGAHPQENWLHSGFRFQRRRWLLPAENFQIGILVYSEGRANFTLTAHRLDLTGKGEGLIAK